ncbi:MAG TPA: hypothetical protein VEZ20_12290 [Allosphingosinicella sp.]|nr:hypothetical protein [Allosphingosinicella sp.]
MKPAAFLPMILPAILLAAACARSEPATDSPTEANQMAVEQVRSTGGGEEETALGQWRMALQGDRQALEFGPQGSVALVTLICGERNGLVLQRRGVLPPGASPTLSVSVGGQGRPIPVTAGSGAVATQNASIPPSDELIRLISNAQVPISLRFGDSSAVFLPPSPLIGQFAQSCARGAGGRLDPAAASGETIGNMDANAIGNVAEPAAGNAAAPAANETGAAAGESR